MRDPRLNEFIKFFNSQGVKFVDEKTGEEIKPTDSSTIYCPVCDNETPDGDKCMWCQNNIGEKK